ncbi:MAG: hypothetical protein LBN18_02780 [Dysgonamonadaceae bacterium]|jgi:hypothetical protein|nr:hypothetical protein [Dysgonamonadaceae bacterium]
MRTTKNFRIWTVTFVVIATMTSVIFSSCKQVAGQTEISGEFLTENPDWRLLPDTLTKDTSLALFDGQFNLSFRLKYLQAIDTEGVYRIAYYKLERTDDVKDATVTEFRFVKMDIGRIMPLSLDDTTEWRAYEVAAIFADIICKNGRYSAQNENIVYFNNPNDFEE